MKRIPLFLVLITFLIIFETPLPTEAKSSQNVYLRILDAHADIAFTGLNVTVYDPNGTSITSAISNQTGYVNLTLSAGSYPVVVQRGNRTVGHQEIIVPSPETIPILCWAYNINVTVVDTEGKPLSDHVVFIYDQLVFHSPTNYTLLTNQTGQLIQWNKTDTEGRAYFRGIWNGTYRIQIAGARLVGESSLNLQGKDAFTLISGNKADVTFRFTSMSGNPLPDVTVYIWREGQLLFKGYTNRSGYIHRKGMYLGNYTVFAEYIGVEVWQGEMEVSNYTLLTLAASVFRLTLRSIDPFGNALPGAEVVVLRRKWKGAVAATEFLRLEANETGYVSLLLPRGDYVTHVSQGIYSYSVDIELIYDYEATIVCNVPITVWLLTTLVAVPIMGVTALLERKKGRRPLKVRKYKKMLSKLDSMYERGLIEYTVYRKLREEYEEILIKLGREVR